MASDQFLEMAPSLALENRPQTKDRLKCGDVAELVNLAEIRICGQDHIGTAAFAQGLARLGERSASRLGDARSLSWAPSVPVPCVYHSFSGGDLGVPHTASVVLVAGTHQDAVDHCLIAQRIAGDLRIPVHCLADCALQACLGCVELPSRSSIEEFSDAAPLSESGTLFDLIPSFTAASHRLGSEHQPVMSFGPEAAQQVVIACGREAALARTLVEHGCFSRETRLLQVQLLRPFPDQELLHHLEDSEELILLAQPDDPLDVELLAALEIRAAGNPHFPKLTLATLPVRPLTSLDLLRALPAYLVESGSEERVRLTPEASLQLQIGVTPGGRWSRELLLESASAIFRAISPTIQRDTLSIRLDEEVGSTFSKLNIGTTDEDANGLDLLFLTENKLVDAEPAIERLKKGGILIVHAESPDITPVWQVLSAESKRLIVEENIEIWWIRPADLIDSSKDIADLSCQVLNGALLRSLAAKLDLDSSGLESASLSILETAGLQAVRKFNRADLAVGRFIPEGGTAVVTTTEFGKPPSHEKDWRNALRAFHLTGCGAYSESEPLPGLPLWPALASKLVDDHRIARQYPLILPSPPEIAKGIEPLSLHHILESSLPDADGESSERSEELERAVRQTEKTISETPSQTIAENLAAAVEEISPSNGNDVEKADLRDRPSPISEFGQLVGFGTETLPVLYSWAVATERQELEIRFQSEVEELMVGLQNLLQVDLSHREREGDAESLAAKMGEKATAFVDLQKLSRNLPQVGGSATLSETLLELTRETLGVLQAFHASGSRSDPFYLISSGEGPEFPELPANAQFVNSDCFEAALGFVNGLLQRMSGVFRAVRVARLLISGQYNPEVHDEVFSRFEWQSCNAKEILLVPRVLVVESSAGLKNKGTAAALSQLLRTGQPVHVLITQDHSGLSAEDLSGTLEDRGAMAMAHREAFVLQSNLARPDHLLGGLLEMARTVSPSIAFVSSHPTSQQGKWAWASELMVHYSRLAPCFRYSPEHGSSWSERIDISANPQLESGLPVVNLSCASLPAAAEKIDESVTFAHAAALQPEFRGHFRVIPSRAWSDDQETIADYLDKFESTPPPSLPYIWIVRNGELCRAIMTREMANACRDRRLAWKGLQELAVINSKFVRQARDEVQRELEARYQNENENARAQGREEGAVQAVNRIVAALLGNNAKTVADQLLETGEGGRLQPSGSTPTPTKPLEKASQPETPASTAQEVGVPVGKPYIDTQLCTSCNDCLKINPLLFVYNADNQAEIGDPLAGTFVELVKAAEKCPARCIHPGSPRPDDKSATPAMIKRASKFV